MATRRSRLLALNDSRLAAYLSAEDEDARSLELERILSTQVQPRVRAVLNVYLRTEWPLAVHDVDDIVGQVTLRVLRKLRAAILLEEESVQNVEAYVTTLTKNAARDVLRSRSPARTRIKSRLRYLFSHDPRFALWVHEGVTLCGLAAWSERADYEPQLDVLRRAVAAAGHSASDPGREVIAAVLTAVDKPLRLVDLVSALVGTEPGGDRSSTHEGLAERQGDVLEARQYLQVLWREIRDLPLHQRIALLLNLREPESGNAVRLFVSVGIAPLEEIAAALQMTLEQLGALWDDLPLDDLRIATHLGLQRQQVINLRKAARKRLARRMKKS
jgi:hypothetical protein